MRYSFWCCGIPMNTTRKRFCDWWCMLNTFVSTCDFRITWKNKTYWFDTEGFMPVVSLCGVVGSPPWFNTFLLAEQVVYDQSWTLMQNIYSSETCACTIIECVIVYNIRHVTSTWPLITWCSGAANNSRNPPTERSYWNSLEINCMPESVWIVSISHQQNSSTFPNIYWNVSSLSMTSSVVIFSIT